MSRHVVALLFVCCLAAALPTGALAVAPAGSAGPASTATASPTPSVAPPTASPPDGPALVGVHPNPVSDGDVGEFVVLDVPPSTNLMALRVCDDEGCLAPDRAATGCVAVTRAPERVRPLVDTPVVGAEGDLSLANRRRTGRSPEGEPDARDRPVRRRAGGRDVPRSRGRR